MHPCINGQYLDLLVYQVVLVFIYAEDGLTLKD